MRKLLYYRNRFVRNRVIIIFGFFVVLAFSQFPYIKQSINVGHYASSPRVYNYAELEEALKINGSAKITTDFLQETGVYLGLTDQSVVQYTYSYTNFSNHFLIIAQEGSKDQQLNFSKPRDIVVRSAPQEGHYDAHQLIISEFANLLEVPRKSIEGEFHPHTLILSAMRPHLQIAMYGLLSVFVIGMSIVILLYRSVTTGITSSVNFYHLETIDANINDTISNTRRLLIIKDYIIYKPTLNFDKQSIFIKDVTIVGIKRFLNRFEVVICLDAYPEPLHLYLNKQEAFLILEVLKMYEVDYIRDDKYASIELWHLDPYRKS